MKHIHRSLTLLLILLSNTLFAQEEITIKELLTTDPVPVYDPLITDSLDVNRKQYNTKNLLQTHIDFSTIQKSTTTIKSDNDGKFELPFAPYDPKIMYRDKAIQLLKFNIDADQYCQASLEITATDRFEVYLNGKKESTKDSKQDSLTKASPITINLTLEPQQYEIIIKRLAQVRNFDEAAMKITLKADKKFQDAHIKTTLSGKRRMTINDVLEGSRITANSLSPTGKYYMYNIRHTYPGSKTRDVMELRELNTNQLVYRFPSSISPRWKHKEDKIIYSRAGETERDLILFDPATMEETTIAQGINLDSYTMSPNGQFLIITRREEIPADKGDLKRTLSPSDRAGNFRHRNVLYLYTFDTQVTQRITFGRTNIWLNDISPDSQKALISTSEETNERPLSKSILYEMDLTTLQLDTLIIDPFVSNGKYSPDGKYLMINAPGEAFQNIGLNIAEGQISNLYDTQTFLFNLKNREVTPITKHFNPSISGVQWSHYDNNLYFRTEDKDRAQIYRYDIKAATFTHLPLPEEMIASFQMSYNNPIAMFRGESHSNAYRLYSLDLRTGQTTLLLDPFADQLAQLDLPPVTDWSFTASNGTEIDATYYLPHNYDPSKQYPMIVYYYGGTSPTSHVFESTYPLHTYAALGYVVLTINPSGTTGYGQEFAARHVNAWGKVTADDIIEGTQQFCKEHLFIDPTKIGCIGASYGGFMTQYLLTQTDIFAAGISHAGISNIASYWGEGYWGYSYSMGASAFSFPWNNPDLYVGQSPLFQADKINTPLLLLHGNADTNVPLGESVQMFNALRLLGKEVEFIQVQGENHGILEYKKRIEWNKTIHAWFARWLKDQPEWWEALYPER